MVNFIQKIIHAVHVPKCWNGAAYVRKRTCIFELSVKPRAVLKLLEQYQSPNTWFLIIHSISFLKHALESYGAYYACNKSSV